MSFLLPAAFAALAALLLPLLIHLNRASERKPTDFAALRWLSETTRPRRRLQFDELLLLLLRLLMLALVVVFLAQPVVTSSPGARNWVVVVPGVERDAARSALGSAAAGAEWRWLAPGYPAFSLPAPAGATPVNSLLRELDAALPTDATLSALVPEEVGGLDGELAALSRPVEWRVVAGNAPATVPVDIASRRRVAVRHAREDEPGLRYLRAAIASWSVGFGPRGTAAGGQAATRYEIEDAAAGSEVADGTPWLVWLAPGELPEGVRDWIEDGGVALLDVGTKLPELDHATALWRNDAGESLVQGVALGQGRAMRFARELRPDAMPELLEPGFPQQLHALFLPPPTPPARADAKAVAPGQRTEPLSGEVRSAAAARLGNPDDTRGPLQSLLAVLIGALFLLERAVATRAKRWRRAT